MSASLVGSEMCIRDRGPFKPVGEELERLGERQDHLQLESRGPGFRGRPVSYTHLTLPTICSV
eukprot:14081550-Alexandrium_andersonii.AAC.1